MRPEYDFRGGVRGKYVSRYRDGTNVVVLDPDVAAAFPNADAVNQALRKLLDVVPAPRTKSRVRLTTRSNGPGSRVARTPATERGR